MNREKIYLSTIAPDAAAVAREYGLGLELWAEHPFKKARENI